MNITQIAAAVVTLISAIIMVTVIPRIKASGKVDEVKTAIERAGILVRAVEQMYPNLTGARKLEWVKTELSNWGITLDVVPLRAVIEAEVLDMRAELGMLPGEKTE